MALTPSSPSPTAQGERHQEELVGGKGGNGGGGGGGGGRGVGGGGEEGGEFHCNSTAGHYATAQWGEEHDAGAGEELGDHAGSGEEEDEWWGAPEPPSSASPRPRRRSNSSRRHPTKAEIFRRLDASCEARDVREAELLHPLRRPPPPETEEPDVPLWPPNTASWRSLCYLRDREAARTNHLVSPAENTVSHQPSKKSQKMVSDKDEDQGYEDECSSESVPNHIVLHETGQGENQCSPTPSKRKGLAIGAYAVQCKICPKWRLIPTKRKYEEIREKNKQVPFLCEHASEWNPGVTCHDPPDISQDDNKVWAVDKPGIPQTPLGWERIVTIRSYGSTKFADVYYVPPEGKTLRSTTDVRKYLEQNPQHAAGLQLDQFSFKIPTPLQRDYVRKRPPQSKHPQPIQVLPLSYAPPVHMDPVSSMLVLYNEGNPASDMPQDQLQGDDQT